VTILPAWMKAVSGVLPPTYVFQGLRAIVAGRPAPWDRLAIGLALAGAFVVAACLVFAAVYRYAIRTGLIARYSAESVS
jgi:ABC-2 type transport system permease protein